MNGKQRNMNRIRASKKRNLRAQERLLEAGIKNEDQKESSRFINRKDRRLEAKRVKRIQKKGKKAFLREQREHEMITED